MSYLKEKYEQFINKAVFKTINHKDKEIEYYTLGDNSTQTLLLLTGGSGVSEPFFEYCLFFSKRFKVISFNYPECESLNSLVDIIFSIINNEQVKDLYICAQSMGGIIAQVMLLKQPKLIKKLVLCHTTTVTKNLQQLYANKLKENTKTLKDLEPVPELVLKQAVTNKIKKSIEQHLFVNTEFWTNLFQQSIKQCNKQQLITPIILMNDFAKNYCFNEFSFADNANKVLIIDSKADKAFTAEQKLALNNIFKDASKQHFVNESHMGILESSAKYINLIDSFFENKL
ncbi:alpha/beta hydrolase [Clostridium sp. 'deep sea']|uniref:alpha/beta hydrolase n=1 Tax=Clostridium sp. 'deep sea' TaxID=2779445 RepID=UPI0018967087|nr:alpha/beta hydrolase [Clostridium sp. 'deep sea']QOR36517.1 alpha/beta hydrolase [Clostridium sp. 'deep sea']